MVLINRLDPYVLDLLASIAIIDFFFSNFFKIINLRLLIFSKWENGKVGSGVIFFVASSKPRKRGHFFCGKLQISKRGHFFSGEPWGQGELNLPLLSSEGGFYYFVTGEDDDLFLGDFPGSRESREICHFL